METRTVELEIPEGLSPEAFLEQQQREARRRPQELESFGGRSKKLVAEIAKLTVARGEQMAQAEQLGEMLESHLAELGMLRASGFLGGVDSAQVATIEEKAAALQDNLARVNSVIAGIDRLLQERYGALPAAQLEDLEAAIARNGKALAKAKKAFLDLLGAAATDLKAAGLHKQKERWQELVDERRGMYEALYHPDRVGGSEDRADRQIRSEISPSGDYGLFSGDVAECILDLVECILDLYETRDGRPAVRGRD